MKSFLNIVLAALVLLVAACSGVDVSPDPTIPEPETAEPVTAEPADDPNAGPEVGEPGDPVALEPEVVAPVSVITDLDAVSELVQNENWSAEALVRYRSVLRSDRTNRKAALGLAKVLLRRGETSEARSAVSEYLSSAPGDSEALGLLAAIYIARDEARMGLDDLRARVDVAPEDLSKQVVLMRIMIAAGEQRRAIERIRELLRKDEVNVELMKTLARAYISLGKYRTARYILEKRVKELMRNQIDADIAYMMAHILKHTSTDVRKQVDAYQLVIQLRPDLAEAHNNLGLIYYETRNYTQAAQEFMVAYRLAPGLVGAKLNLANAYKALGEYEKSRDIYLEITSAHPDYSGAYYNLGVLYFENEFGEEKKKDLLARSIGYFEQYRKALGPRLSPQDPVNGYIAEAHDLRKQIDRAAAEEEQMRAERIAKFKKFEAEANAKLTKLGGMRAELERRAMGWVSAGNAEKAEEYNTLLTEFDDLFGGSIAALKDAMKNEDGDEVEAVLADFKWADEEFLPKVEGPLAEDPPPAAGGGEPTPGPTTEPVVEPVAEPVAEPTVEPEVGPEPEPADETPPVE
ncbi:MAG: tetratricopeptide repeat protein [Pseudomonadota bacterium]